MIKFFKELFTKSKPIPLKKMLYPKEIVVLQYVTSPDKQTYLRCITPDQIGAYESLKVVKDYFCLVDDTIYFHSRAPYNYVLVNGLSKKMVEDAEKIAADE